MPLDSYPGTWYNTSMGKRQKFKTSFSLSVECKRLIRLLSNRFGISQTGVIEMLIREKARTENLQDGMISGNKACDESIPLGKI